MHSVLPGNPDGLIILSTITVKICTCVISQYQWYSNTSARSLFWSLSYMILAIIFPAKHSSNTWRSEPNIFQKYLQKSVENPSIPRECPKASYVTAALSSSMVSSESNAALSPFANCGSPSYRVRHVTHLLVEDVSIKVHCVFPHLCTVCGHPSIW